MASAFHKAKAFAQTVPRWWWAVPVVPLVGAGAYYALPVGSIIAKRVDGAEVHNSTTFNVGTTSSEKATAVIRQVGTDFAIPWNRERVELGMMDMLKAETAAIEHRLEAVGTAEQHRLATEAIAEKRRQEAEQHRLQAEAITFYGGMWATALAGVIATGVAVSLALRK